MITWLTEPWLHQFMQHAFLAVMLVGIIAGAIGVYVTLRGLAFLGDALAHAIFPGVVVAFVMGGNYLIGALVAGVVVSLLIGAVSQNGRIKNDSAIGIFFVGAFALGIALMSQQSGYVRDLNAFLFGSILGVTSRDLLLTAIAGAVVLGLLAIFRREMTMIAFDRTFARSQGLRLWRYDQLFLALLAASIVISLQTVGNILVLSMLVTPAATARMLTNDLKRMILISSSLGAINGLAGLYISYYWSVPSGAAIVLTSMLVFVAIFLFAPRTGMITVSVAHLIHHPHPEADERRVQDLEFR